MAVFLLRQRSLQKNFFFLCVTGAIPIMIISDSKNATSHVMLWGMDVNNKTTTTTTVVTDSHTGHSAGWQQRGLNKEDKNVKLPVAPMALIASSFALTVAPLCVVFMRWSINGGKYGTIFFPNKNNGGFSLETEAGNTTWRQRQKLVWSISSRTYRDSHRTSPTRSMSSPVPWGPCRQ